MRKLAIALFTLIALLAAPVGASAHAGLVSANPEADKEITLMPERISLTFTENLLVLDGKNVNSITLARRPSSDVGQVIALTDFKVEGATISAAIPAENYESGTYQVNYTIVSADGHKVNESYTFSLNAPTLLALPQAGEAEAGEAGALPLVIAGAIALVILVGGIYIFRARNRSN